MNIKGETISVNKSNEYVYTYLSDFSNFKNIMPENTTKFESSEEGFVFALAGMPEIPLKLKEKTPYSLVCLTSAKDSVRFTLQANISPLSDSSCEVYLDFNGEFNPFIQMMVEKPLKNFINSLSENLKKL